MTSGAPFHYVPTCRAQGCNAPARYRIAAPWSDGTSSELKNYGLACENCRDLLLADARARRARLKLAEGEIVGEVQAFPMA